MRMKNIILYAAMSSLVCMVSSCEEDGNLAEGGYKPSLKACYLGTDGTEFLKSADAQTWNTQVYAGENSWKFNGYDNWINLTPNSGIGPQSVLFSVAENTSGIDSRTSVFNLLSTESDWSYTTRMSISQQAARQQVWIKGNDGTFVKNANLDFTGKAGFMDVLLKTNCIPTVSTSYASWLTATYSQEDQKIHLEVQENTSSDTRTATVTVRTPENSSEYVTIYVSQEKANLTVSDKSQLVFENTAGTYELEVNSEAAWTVSNNVSWITTSVTGGTAGVSKLGVSVSPNTSTQGRSGSIYLYLGSNQVVEIEVVQRGIYVDAGGDVYKISSDAQKYEFEVKGNVPWTVESSSEWLTVSPSSGLAGTTKVTAMIADNQSVQGRLGWLIFTSEGTDIKEKKNFTQEGKSFEIGAEKVSFDDKASTQSVEIETNGSWTATKRENYDWFSITPESGDGNGKLNITVLANNTMEERIGYIDVSMCDATTPIVVHQNSKYFTVDATDLDFTSLSTSSMVKIATNDAWKTSIENNASWITLNPTEGEGDCDMNVSIADNPSTKSRAAYVDVTGVNTGKVVRLNYMQAARFLRTSVADFTFFAKGGSSETVYISSDAKFTITQEGGWFSVDRIDNFTFTVTATPNKTDSERTGKIIIRATDLQEGELVIEMPVKQVDKNSTFTKGEFSSDDSWDLVHDSKATIKVVGFAADKSWDVNTKSTGNISFSAYGEDSNWDVIKKSNATIVGNGYGKDNSWNVNIGSTGNINGNGYDKDGDWNTNNGSTGNISGSDFGKDKDWNNNK